LFAGDGRGAPCLLPPLSNAVGSRVDPDRGAATASTAVGAPTPAFGCAVGNRLRAHVHLPRLAAQDEAWLGGLRGLRLPPCRVRGYAYRKCGGFVLSGQLLVGLCCTFSQGRYVES